MERLRRVDRAWWAIAVLVASLALAQPLALALGEHYLARWGSPGNPYNQWAAYRARGTPEVLILGDSRVRYDIDPDELAATLAVRVGRPVTVATIGIDGVKPTVLAAIAHEIASRPPRPRVVVLVASEHEYNRSWDEAADGPGDQTGSYWQLSDRADPLFALVAMRLSADPGRLVAGWALPLLRGYAPIAEGARCDLELLRGQDACTDTSRPPDGRISAAKVAEQTALFRRTYLRDYTPSGGELAAAAEAIRVVRIAGAVSHVLVLPVLGAERLDAAAYDRFEGAMRGLSASSRVTLTDLRDVFADRQDLFVDLGHLNRTGARALLPALADAISPDLP